MVIDFCSTFVRGEKNFAECDFICIDKIYKENREATQKNWLVKLIKHDTKQQVEKSNLQKMNSIPYE